MLAPKPQWAILWKSQFFCFISFISLLLRISSWPYSCQTADGKPAKLIVGENYFLDQTPHPLMSALRLRFEGAKYLVQYPPMIDEMTTSVYFNHDAFTEFWRRRPVEAALAYSYGSHQAFQGPVSFTAMDHQWKTGQKKQVWLAWILKSSNHEHTNALKTLGRALLICFGSKF